MKTVKKSLLVCLFSCLLIKTDNVLGQSRFAIGPIAGASRGYINMTIRNYFKDPTYQDKGYGPLIGVMGHYFLTSRWSISTGVNYHRINYNRKTPDKVQYKWDCWNIPVLLNYRPSVHNFSPYFSLGAAASTWSTYLDVAIPKPKIPTSLDMMIGAGVIYKSNSKVSWIIQPLWQKEVAPKPSNLILSNYQSHKISLQVQLLFQL